MSSADSVQRTDAGTQSTRLRATSRLKMCVSWTCGTSPLHRMRATDCPTVPNPSRATRELSDPTLELSSARPQRSGVSVDTGTRRCGPPRVVPGQSWKTQKRTTAALYPVAISRFLRSSLVGLQFHFVPGGRGHLLLISSVCSGINALASPVVCCITSFLFMTSPVRCDLPPAIPCSRKSKRAISRCG